MAKMPGKLVGEAKKEVEHIRAAQRALYGGPEDIRRAHEAGLNRPLSYSHDELTWDKVLRRYRNIKTGRFAKGPRREFMR
jgi:hypothetical protein